MVTRIVSNSGKRNGKPFRINVGADNFYGILQSDPRCLKGTIGVSRRLLILRYQVAVADRLSLARQACRNSMDSRRALILFSFRCAACTRVSLSGDLLR